jgi:phosphoribosyl-AMP cyclohydrolase
VLHSESLNRALIGPLAQKAQRVFCFYGLSEAEVIEIDFVKAGGLVPAIIQDERTGDVLMLGFMNAEALSETRRSGEVVFFSRSRSALWKKGESSGHVLRVREVRFDCDRDALLLRVEPAGPGVCHEGYRSCFFRRIETDGSATVIAERTFSAEEVYGKEKSR